LKPSLNALKSPAHIAAPTHLNGSHAPLQLPQSLDLSPTSSPPTPSRSNQSSPGTAAEGCPTPPSGDDQVAIAAPSTAHGGMINNNIHPQSEGDHINVSFSKPNRPLVRIHRSDNIVSYALGITRSPNQKALYATFSHPTPSISRIRRARSKVWIVLIDAPIYALLGSEPVLPLVEYCGVLRLAFTLSVQPFYDNKVPLHYPLMLPTFKSFTPRHSYPFLRHHPHVAVTLRRFRCI
jgi:hypothetical protein